MSSEAPDILRREAKFLWPTIDYHQVRIARMADHLRWGARRVRAIYNRESVVLRERELTRLADIKAAQQAREAEATNAVRQSQEEYRDLAARIAALEALFQAGDEEHGRPFLDAYRALARGQGG